MSLRLQTHGFAHADAMAAATARYYDQLYAQTRLLAFLDCFYILGIMTLIVAPLALLTGAFRASSKAPDGH